MDRIPIREVSSDFAHAVTVDSLNHNGRIESFVEILGRLPPIGRDLLELGTSTSLLAIALCQTHGEVRVMAADWDVQLLELARYRLESACLTNRIQLQWIEPPRLIFQDEYFDTAYSLYRCHEWRDPLTLLHEMYRVVRKGGLVCVRDWIRPDTAEQLEEALLELGPEETTELENSARDLHRQSLLASWSADEIRSMMESLEWEGAMEIGDRQWTYYLRKP